MPVSFFFFFCFFLLAFSFFFLDVSFSFFYFFFLPHALHANTLTHFGSFCILLFLYCSRTSTRSIIKKQTVASWIHTRGKKNMFQF